MRANEEQNSNLPHINVNERSQRKRKFGETLHSGGTEYGPSPAAAGVRHPGGVCPGPRQHADGTSSATCAPTSTYFSFSFPSGDSGESFMSRETVSKSSHALRLISVISRTKNVLSDTKERCFRR